MDNRVRVHGVTIYNKRHGPPPWAVYVGRPTIWGNPFVIDYRNPNGRWAVIRDYETWISRPEQVLLRTMMKQRLRGRDLVCWCSPASCHAEIIARIAND